MHTIYIYIYHVICIYDHRCHRVTHQYQSLCHCVLCSCTNQGFCRCSARIPNTASTQLRCLGRSYGAADPEFAVRKPHHQHPNVCRNGEECDHLATLSFDSLSKRIWLVLSKTRTVRPSVASKFLWTNLSGLDLLSCDLHRQLTASNIPTLWFLPLK